MVLEGIGRSVIRRGPFNILCGAGSIKLSLLNAEWRGIHLILCIILPLYFSVHYMLLLIVETIYINVVRYTRLGIAIFRTF